LNPPVLYPRQSRHTRFSSKICPAITACLRGSPAPCSGGSSGNRRPGLRRVFPGISAQTPSRHEEG
jgi:hypothetical protein